MSLVRLRFAEDMYETEKEDRIVGVRTVVAGLVVGLPAQFLCHRRLRARWRRRLLCGVATLRRRRRCARKEREGTPLLHPRPSSLWCGKRQTSRCLTGQNAERSFGGRISSNSAPTH